MMTRIIWDNKQNSPGIPPFIRLIKFDKDPLKNDTKQNGSKIDGALGQVLLPSLHNLVFDRLARVATVVDF